MPEQPTAKAPLPMSRIRELYAAATGWRFEDDPDRPDLAANRDSQRAEFDLALVQHSGKVIAAAAERLGIGAIADVLAERARQDAKWGQQDHADGTGPFTQPLHSGYDTQDDEELQAGTYALYFAEELTRRCEARFDGRGAHSGTWTDIFLEEVFEALAEDDPAKLRAELVQSAAVLVAWIEAIDRRTDGEQPGAES